jgi:hypothetical protein
MTPEHPPRRPRQRRADRRTDPPEVEHIDPNVDTAAVARNVRSAGTPIVIEPPGYVELSEADRRAAVAALADLLAIWWEREQRATGE